MAYKEKTFRIYGKHEDDKRFSALGSDGLIGNGNLIYAYFFTIKSKEEEEDLDRKIANLNSDNPEFKFEKRRA